jgi:hypothetical protein
MGHRFAAQISIWRHPGRCRGGQATCKNAGCFEVDQCGWLCDLLPPPDACVKRLVAADVGYFVVLLGTRRPRPHDASGFPVRIDALP